MIPLCCIQDICTFKNFFTVKPASGAHSKPLLFTREGPGRVIGITAKEAG